MYIYIYPTLCRMRLKLVAMQYCPLAVHVASSMRCGRGWMPSRCASATAAGRPGAVIVPKMYGFRNFPLTPPQKKERSSQEINHGLDAMWRSKMESR